MEEKMSTDYYTKRMVSTFLKAGREIQWRIDNAIEEILRVEAERKTEVADKWIESVEYAIKELKSEKEGLSKISKGIN